MGTDGSHTCTCDHPGYHLDSGGTSCIAYAGTCDNGEMIAQSSRTRENHCGTCDSGYHHTSHPSNYHLCIAYAGTCDNGEMIAQSSRTCENHCGTCDSGYHLRRVIARWSCIAYAGTCAHGEMIAQSLRTQKPLRNLFRYTLSCI